MKQFFAVAVALVIVCGGALSQTRYVTGLGKEARMIPPGKSSVELARAMGWTNATKVAHCPTSLVAGFTTPSSVNFGFNDGDVLLTHLLAPVTGVIESLYFSSEGLTVSSMDSSVVIRIFESAFTPANPQPSGTVYLGYYDWPSDPIGLSGSPPVMGNTPYADAPGVGSWVVGDTTASPPGFDPNGVEIWGFGGFFTTWNTNSLMSVAMIDLGVEPAVTAGDYFNVNFRFPAQSVSDGQRRESLMDGEGNDPFDFLKYYYRGRTGPSAPGWWAREFNPKVYAVIRASGNLPPIVTSVSDLNSTIDTGPQTVLMRAFDCNAAVPADTGIASAELFYNVDGGKFNSVAMTNPTPPEWSGVIPGMAFGTTVEAYVEVTDNLGLITETTHQIYSVVDLNRNGYMTDPNATFNFIDISGTGTAIMNLDYFSGGGSDDGTAGPFDIGGDFQLFGGTGRFAWVIANGGISLSTDPTDTADIGFIGPGFIPAFGTNLPDAVNFPSNFIGGLFNDLNPGGGGTVYYQDLGTMFVVQFQDVIPFGGMSGVTFEIILDRTDPAVHKVYFQYADVGTEGLELSSLVGIQGESSANWVLVNSGGFPIETQPASGKLIVLSNTTPTGVEPITGEVPEVFALHANYPNPFNPSTRITYSIPTTAEVTLSVYDVLGQKVATLVNEVQEAGAYAVNFAAEDLSSGLYFYTIKAGQFADTKKMLLLR